MKSNLVNETLNKVVQEYDNVKTRQTEFFKSVTGVIKAQDSEVLLIETFILNRRIFCLFLKSIADVTSKQSQLKEGNKIKIDFFKLDTNIIQGLVTQINGDDALSYKSHPVKDFTIQTAESFQTHVQRITCPARLDYLIPKKFTNMLEMSSLADLRSLIVEYVNILEKSIELNGNVVP